MRNGDFLTEGFRVHPSFRLDEGREKEEIQTLWRKLRYYVFIRIRTRKSGLLQGEDQIKGAGSHSSTEFFFVYYRLTIKRYKIFDAAVTF